MEEFIKKCGNPECENIQVYKSKDALKNAIKANSKCRNCAYVKTEEHKKKISEAQIKYCSIVSRVEHFGGEEKYKEKCKKQADKLKGRKRLPFSDEWKAKMGETRRNSEIYQNWMKSDEYRKTRQRIAIENHHPDLTHEEWLEMTDDRKIYYSQVWFHTEKQPLHLLENIEKRSEHSKNPDAYHLDHIVPISYGFKKQISPEIIGDISNLQMLPWLENILKGNKYEGNCENLRKIDNNNS